MLRIAVFMAASAFAFTPAQAQEFEDLEVLEARVAAQVANSALPIDRRLKLVRCPDPAQIDAPALGAVAIRCPAKGWRIRVALVAPVATAFASSAVAVAFVIRRGDIIDLTVVGDGFELSAAGTALDDAALGNPVRVKISTAASVRAIATGDGIAIISR
jgi:flagellar basal body P-ring formation protein FlgA